MRHLRRNFWGVPIITMLLLIIAGVLYPLSEAKCDRTVDSLQRRLKTVDIKRKGDVYMALAEHYMLSDTSKTLYYFNCAINSYKGAKHNVNEIVTLLNLSVYYTSIGQTDLSVNTLKSAIAESKEMKLDQYFIYGYAILCAAYRRMGHYDKAIDVYTKVYPKYNFAKMSAKYAKIKKEKGKLTKPETSLFAHLVLFYNNVALVYRDIGMKDDTYRMFKYAKYMADEIGVTNYKYIVYFNLINFFVGKKQYDSAFKYLKKSEKIVDKIDDPLIDKEINMLKAGILMAMKRYKEVMDICDRNINLHSCITISTSFDLVTMGRCAKKLGMYGKLKKILDTLQINLNDLPIDLKVDYYKLQSDYYKLRNDFKTATLFSDTLLALKDSIIYVGNNEMLIRQIADLKYNDKINAIKLQNRDKELIERKLSAQNKVQFTFIFVLIILFVIVFLIIRNYLINRRLVKTIDLKNLELTDVNKQLDISNATKDKFFSIIAHDLKNPIGNTKEAVVMLDDNFSDFSDDERREYISMLKDTCNTAYLLLTDLLARSQSQSENIKIDLRESVPYDDVKKIISLQAISAKNKDIELVNSVPKEMTIYSDSYLFRTILRNLVSNAIKFTNSGGTIEIGVQQCEKDGFVIIYVKDNGVGMSEKQLSTIFRIDVNSSTTGTAGETGTGLGLILCKEFAKKNGGDITVTSKEGNGTQFNIMLATSKDSLSQQVI